MASIATTRQVVMVTNRIGVYKGQTGGGSTMRDCLCAALAAEGINVVPFAAGRGAQDVRDTARGPMLPATARNLGLLFEAVRKSDLVIVSGSYTPMWLYAAVLARWWFSTQLLFICTMDADKAAEHFAGGLREWLSRHLFILNDWLVAKLASRVYCRSDTHKAKLRGFGIEADGVMVQSDQYKHFFPPTATDAADIAAARQWLSRGQAGPLLLFAGRLIPEKRIAVLVAAKPANCVLAIVGGGSESNLAAAARLHDPRNRVFVHPIFVTQSRLRVLFWAADVHVSASDYETLGNTVHEALLCGTPVVVQNAGGYVSQVKSGRQGFLVDFDDKAAVQTAIDAALRLCDVGPIKRDGCTEGRELVRAMLDQHQHARESSPRSVLDVHLVTAASSPARETTPNVKAASLVALCVVWIVLDTIYYYLIA